MLAPKVPVQTPPTASPSQFDISGMAHAFAEAATGLSEGGVPIGAALIRSDGTVIGVGRNRRFQQGSATRHGEVRFGSLNGGRRELMRGDRRTVWRGLGGCLLVCMLIVRCLRLCRPVQCARELSFVGPSSSRVKWDSGLMRGIVFGIKRCVMGENETFVRSYSSPHLFCCPRQSHQ
jgi:hypothetical protein